jgi:hypothetical protein
MQKLNFKITDSVSLVMADKNFDLHNDFDFFDFDYAFNLRRFVMRWQKSSGDWVAANLPTQYPWFSMAFLFWLFHQETQKCLTLKILVCHF